MSSTTASSGILNIITFYTLPLEAEHFHSIPNGLLSGFVQPDNNGQDSCNYQTSMFHFQ